MPPVEWALTLMGHCNPKEEYPNGIASTNHLKTLCFITGPPLVQLPKPTKSCPYFLYEAEHSMYTFRALTGQRRDSWLPVGGKSTESAMTWALNGFLTGKHLGLEDLKHSHRVYVECTWSTLSLWWWRGARHWADESSLITSCSTPLPRYFFLTGPWGGASGGVAL